MRTRRSRSWARAASGAALVAVVLAAACGARRAVPTFRGAPVVLISIDTMRADRLPAYGYTRIRTPNLDRFAQQAWLFESAYTPCPMTLPAHTTMLTGQLPPEHGVRNNAGFTFDAKAHGSLPQLLKQHGYATGAAVSSYVLRYETGLGQLFDAYEDSLGTAPGVESVHYRRSGDKTEAFAREWIAKHAAEPFFYFFHIYEPHLPYDPPEPFRSEYGVSYDAEVATADAIVGGFLEDLKRLGVFDRAVIVVTGDHGEGLGDHGEEQHSVLLYREVLHVPLLLRLPGGFGGGRRVAAPAQLSDILPTVTAALGLDTPKEVSGSSLLGLADAADHPRLIYGETLFPRIQLGWSDLHCVLDSRYHYIAGPRPELYDMTADPGEKHDLVKADAADAARLAQGLAAFPQGNESPSAVDAETLRRLSALGYIGGVRGRAEGGPLPNPVDNLRFLERMQEGWRLAADKKIGPAIAALRSVVGENPRMSDVWVKLGELYTAAGLDAESADAYQHALDSSPVYLPDIAVALGFVDLRMNRPEAAEAIARRAAADVPGKAHELLARVALARGDLVAAEGEARAAAGSRNPQPSAVLIMAEVKLREGRPADALEVVGRAEKFMQELRLPAVYDLEFVRGDALARLNRMDEAEAAFRREIASFPEHSQAYANLAVIRFLRGDRAGVEKLLEQMTAAAPSARTYLLAATTCDSLGLKTAAEEWRRRARASVPPPAAR